jgi:MFS family permease
VPLRIRVRPVLSGQLGRLLAAMAAFEVGNVAATLLILRATELLTPAHGAKTATTIAIGLYVGYNAAATLASVPAGRASDRLGTGGPVRVLAVGVAAFAIAYAGFAVAPASVEACTLPTAQRPLRLAEFDDLFATALRGQQRLSPTRLRWRLDPAAQPTARYLTGWETECCSFFSFTFTPAGDAVQLDVEVPDAHVDVLDALAERAAAGITG